MLTHNEAISISDYFTVGAAAAPEFRPTCHYAYHQSDAAVLSLHEMFGSGRQQTKHHILTDDEIAEGIDELGVLLFGHRKMRFGMGHVCRMRKAAIWHRTRTPRASRSVPPCWLVWFGRLKTRMPG
ncbi:Saccharopine dehydrogenase [Puniceibacterium sp. IMCC21224]|nr:Saccharopine dehydrogenase [Puniceibacterium sp. IMCC21224]